MAQLIHGVVDGVGDGAGHVLGHRGLHRQVAFTQRADFIQQPHDGLLVTAVVFHLGLVTQFLLARAATHGAADEADDGDQRERAGGHAQPEVGEQARIAQRAERGERFEQLLAVTQHVRRTAGQRRRRGLRGEQLAGTGQDRIGILFHGVPLLLRLLQCGQGRAVADRGDAQFFITIAQRIEHLGEHHRVAGQRIACGGGIGAAGAHFGHAAGHRADHHHLLQGVVDLRRRCTAGRHRADHFVQLRLQCRHAVDEVVRIAGQGQHRRFTGNQLAGALAERLPGLDQRVQRPGHIGFGAVAALQATDGTFDVALGQLERGERLRVARDRLTALVGQLLREHLQVRRIGACTGQATALPGRHAGVDAEHDHRHGQQAEPEIGAHRTELAGLGGFRSSTHRSTSMFNTERQAPAVRPRPA